MTAPSVFTIASERPFVDDLAAGLMARVADEPERLPSYRILLPTRRACRALREAFLRLSGGKTLLLPSMTPIGDVDEDDLALGDLTESLDIPGLPLPPAIGGLRRQLLLARLVMADKSRPLSADQALELAAELALVLDQLQTERIAPDALPDVFPGSLSAHWEKVLEFLNIVLKFWPSVLAEEAALDPADRRNQVLGALAAMWRETPPDGPVIAAGSTGSIPATADLLDCISRLPRGAVVLPGLDQAMTDEAWAGLGPTHPQWGLKQLLMRFDLPRETVKAWPLQLDSAVGGTRGALLAEVMRNPETTDQWVEAKIDFDAALDGVKRIDAPSASAEAQAIALIMRGVVETPEKRCALVTTDRGLARRVAALMARWGLEVDDSAGKPLSATEPASLFTLSAEAVVSGFAPVPLLGLLKHPLCTLEYDRPKLLALARKLEKTTLRGPRPASGLGGLRASIGEIHDDLLSLLDRLEATSSEFRTCLSKPAAPGELLAAHVGFAEALAPAEVLWAGESGEALSLFFADLAEAALDQPELDGINYGSWLNTLLRRQVVRSRYGVHPRLSILGAMEARLQSVDVMILGGLNEGSWPASVETGPWMSRPMQSEIGLPLPERRIGLSAHDFQQAFSAPEVWLTRASRVDGSPTVASRWLTRLDNLLNGAGRPGAITDAQVLHWVDALDRPKVREVTLAPAPKPPLSARPPQLPVTAVETWIRDPYALYAKYILKLRPLDPLDADPGAAERGTIVHDCLEAFVAKYPGGLPEAALEDLIAIGRKKFRGLDSRPAVKAFWWPRFLRIADWFIGMEAKRRAEGWRPVLLEREGRMTIAGVAGGFTLTAKADRIDLGPEGLQIIDYKTGRVPSGDQVRSGLAPQLTLEAHMAASGKFDGLEAAPVAGLLYIKLSGARVPGELKPVKEAPEALMTDAVAGLEKLVQTFGNEDMPYLAKPRVQFELVYTDYDHLARTQAWEEGL